MRKYLYWLKWSIIILGVIFAIIMVCIIFNDAYFHYFCPIDANLASQFGDFIGGFVGTLFGFLSIIILAYSILRQTYENKRNNIKTSFFRMIDYHYKNVEQIELIRPESSIIEKGRKGFVAYKIQFKRLLQVIYEINRKQNFGLNGHDIASIAYMIFYYGLDYSWKDFIRDKIKCYDCREIMINEILKYSKLYPSMKLCRTNQTILSAYFRNMYNAIKLIDSEENFSNKEKYDLIKIFRAQLSNPELYILFFNVISPFGKKWREKRYVQNYCLLKNIPFNYLDGYNAKSYFEMKYEYEEVNCSTDDGDFPNDELSEIPSSTNINCPHPPKSHIWYLWWYWQKINIIMKKLLLNKYITVLVILFCWVSVVSGKNNFTTGYVSPEAFGARGDGKFDDSPAFNKCLNTGKPIKLRKGKVYTLHTRISEISKDILILEGHNARLVIAEDYPLNRSESIFRFTGNVINPQLLQVNDLSISCLLGQKFQDRQMVGDTYIFATSKCDIVQMKKVKFRCVTEYNNVTFLESEGGNVMMDKCDIVLNTRSRQGGIFWMMNKYKENVNILLTNSRFECDTQDEAMCFSAFGEVYHSLFTINVDVKNCLFYSNGNTPSSGFIISYNHAEGVFMDVNIQYTGCTFKTDGQNKRSIQSYQCGDKGGNYGLFKTKFNKCSFIFHLKQKDERGILGLVPASSAMPKKNILYFFNDCSFDIRNTSTLIGDKDGDKKGVYQFTKCLFASNDALFSKRYNKGNGQIDVVLKNCKGTLNDETLCTENLYIWDSKFKNETGKLVYPQGLTHTGKTSLSLINTQIGKNKYSNIQKAGNYNIFLQPRQGYNQISLTSGDIVYGNVNDGRDLCIYYYADKQPSQIFYVVNGNKTSAGYIDKERCYFKNIRFKDNIYHYGKNIVQIESDGEVLTNMEFTIESK